MTDKNPDAETQRIQPTTPPPVPAPRAPDERALAEAVPRQLTGASAARGKARHKKTRHWTWWALWALVAAAAIAIAVVGAHAIKDTDRDAATYPPATPSEDPLVDAARHLKPLDDLERGDRVIYFTKVCTFQEWDGKDGGHDTARIKCPTTGSVHDAQTIKMVPVEKAPAIAIN